jgi:hypothetical protein
MYHPDDEATRLPLDAVPDFDPEGEGSLGQLLPIGPAQATPRRGGRSLAT